jgi:hypothetical protein
LNRLIMRIAVVLVAGSIGSAQAQTGFWGPPQNMGPPINTVHNELSGILINAGTELYFSRTVGGQNDLFVSTREGNHWSRPAALSVLNTALHNELNPTFSEHGKRMFFTSDRDHGVGGFDIWTSERVAGAWTTPVPLGTPVNTENSEWYAAANADGLYLSARTESGLNRGDIFFAAGTYPDYAPRTPILSLATPSREMSVYPSASGDALYITRGTDTIFYDDLWMSRREHGIWSVPYSVNCHVNSSEYEQYPTLSPSEDQLVFAARHQPAGLGGWDLFVSKWHASGDMNADGQASSSDIIYLVSYLFGDGPRPRDPSVEDLTCDKTISVLDVVVLANFVLRMGPAPCVDCSLAPEARRPLKE